MKQNAINKNSNNLHVNHNVINVLYMSICAYDVIYAEFKTLELLNSETRRKKRAQKATNACVAFLFYKTNKSMS